MTSHLYHLGCSSLTGIEATEATSSCAILCVLLYSFRSNRSDSTEYYVQLFEFRSTCLPQTCIFFFGQIKIIYNLWIYSLVLTGILEPKCLWNYSSHPSCHPPFKAECPSSSGKVSSQHLKPRTGRRTVLPVILFFLIGCDSSLIWGNSHWHQFYARQLRPEHP